MSLSVAKRIQRAAQPTVRRIPAYRELAYDYTNQAWIVNGKYQRCGHVGDCNCYGRIHAGESPAANAQIH